MGGQGGGKDGRRRVARWREGEEASVRVISWNKKESCTPKDFLFFFSNSHRSQEAPT